MLPLMKTNVTFCERSISGFGGINVCEDRKGGELYLSENMTSFSFPALSSRKGRTKVYQTDRIINGIGGFEGCFYTSYTNDGTKIFLTFKGVDYEFTSYSASSDFTQKREFAALTDSILIIPDNVIFSTQSKKFTKASYVETRDESTAKSKYKSELGGAGSIDSEYIDHIAIIQSDRIYSRQKSYTYAGTKTFYYSSFPDILKVGDVIVLKLSAHATTNAEGEAYHSLLRTLYNGLTLKIKDIKTLSYQTPAGSKTESVELIFDENAIDLGSYESLDITKFSITRTMPRMNKICSFGNRVWGVGGKYIYASKLSDASEWNDFTVDDYGTLPYASFSTAAQTDGNFTAITPYGNYIYAFKENAIHKIFGDNPDEYVLHTEKCRGVGNDMSDCLAVSSASIIYASDDGIYRYKGDYPQKISVDIGAMPNVISASASEEYYYLLCSDEAGKFLYVYDINRHIWHKESAPTESLILYSYANKVYMTAGGTVFCLNPSEAEEGCERIINWHFGLLIDDSLVEKKGYGKLSLKYSLAKNASFTVRAIYDDGGKGAVCGACYDETENSGAVIFLPIKRCNWFKLEFSGVGEFVLKTINLKFYRGSDI